uniref:Uncharacterized protein n=1 Tax=Romanomermis culicivorax TaxID=13658 RepID=A0A915J926_ROMCU
MLALLIAFSRDATGTRTRIHYYPTQTRTHYFKSLRPGPGPGPVMVEIARAGPVISKKSDLLHP